MKGEPGKSLIIPLSQSFLLCAKRPEMKALNEEVQHNNVTCYTSAAAVTKFHHCEGFCLIFYRCVDFWGCTVQSSGVSRCHDLSRVFCLNAQALKSQININFIYFFLWRFRTLLFRNLFTNNCDEGGLIPTPPVPPSCLYILNKLKSRRWQECTLAWCQRRHY